MFGLPLQTCTSNLKSVALTVLELLAFNDQKFSGSRDPGHAPFGKNLGVMSGLSQRTRVPNLKSVALAVLELFAFNAYFKLVRLTGPLRTETQKHRNTDTHIERTHYLRHSLRSLGGDNKKAQLSLTNPRDACEKFARCT